MQTDPRSPEIMRGQRITMPRVSSAVPEGGVQLENLFVHALDGSQVPMRLCCTEEDMQDMLETWLGG